MDTAAITPHISREVPAGQFPWIRVAALTVLIAWLYAVVLADLATDWWNDPGASYGILVPPFALYIAYFRRHITLAVPAAPDLRGLWIVAAACLLFLIGGLAAEFFLARISFVVLLSGLSLTFWGAARTKTLGFPLVLLATMVPLPGILYNSAAAPLQLFASQIATAVAQMLGVSVYRDGNVIHLAQTSLGVAEACSGLHSLSALLVGSLLIGFLENASLIGRVLLFMLSVPIAIAVNVLRVAGTAVLADYRLEFAEGFYHAFSGWLVFVMGFALLWFSGKLLFRLTRKRI